MKLPTKLAEIREKRGLKQIDVAKAAGVSRVFYTQVENGDRIPSLKKAKPMADALGITLDEFYYALGVTNRDLHSDTTPTGTEGR